MRNVVKVFVYVAACVGALASCGGNNSSAGHPTMAQAGVRSSTTTAGAAVTSFQLTSAVTGTQPFTVGLEFKDGDIPDTPALSIPNSQVIVQNRWNDGSVKMAIASGETALTAGSPFTVSVSDGSAATGRALTATDIQAANPAATVSLGTYGTVSLASLLATPFTTRISGPEMVEAHYRSGVGSDPTLQVWFYVRLYQSGRIWIQAVVENGDLDVATVNKTLANPSVTIGGTTVYSASALAQYANTSWTAEGWIGGDPQIIPTFNTAYLESTGLVPNYLNQTPDAATLNALYQNYVPYQNGGWTTSMGETGYQDQIGILPKWDALYLTSGGDARAYNSVLANAKALTSYAIIWNDSQTNLPVMPSNRPNWTIYGQNQGGGTQIGAGPLTWEIAHHGSGGYLAYLLTGNYYYLALMEQQSATVYLINTSGSQYDPGSGPGTARIILGQTRGLAWANRTIGQLAGIGPSADPIVSDYRNLLATQATHWNSVMQTPGINPLGYLYVYNSYSPTAEVEAPWQQNFWVQTYGYLSDLQPFASMTAWNAVRDHLYETVVGMLGSGGANNYCFTRAYTYNIQIGAVANQGPTTWYTSWGTVDQATIAYDGGTDTSCGNTLLGTSGGAPTGASTGYWGNLMPAIAYAVEDGAPGASAAWARLTGASNWSTVLASGFNDIPEWGIVPRSYPTSAPTPPPVSPTPTPTVTLVASAASLNSGGAATLTWRSSNATSCSGTNFTATGTVGSVSVSPSVTTTYTINCGDYSGTSSSSASATVTIAVNSTSSSPPATGSLSTIVSNMQPGVWTQIANTQLMPLLTVTQNLNNDYTNGNGGPASVIDAWNGSAYDSVGMRWFFHGGGHTDYGGNEVYEFNFNSLSWTQLTMPFELVSTAADPCPVPTVGPPAAHTYDEIVFSPRSNTVWYLDVGGYCSSAASALLPPPPTPPLPPTGTIWEFNPNTATWASRATIVGTVGGVPESGSILDLSGNPIFIAPTGVFQVNPVTDTVAQISGGDNLGYPSATTCGGFVWINDYSTFRKWSFDYSNRTVIAQDGTANLRDPLVTYDSGMSCDATNNRLVFWGGTSTLVFYNIAANTWTEYTPAGGGPTVGASAGPESKWIYIPQYDVYAGYNNVDEGVWLIKLPAPSRP